jgi:peptidoglycan/LPS O-acetylase OafA/YrhL
MNDNAPLVLIGVVLGGAGALKVAGVDAVKKNFARWGYPDPARVVIGGVEVAVGALALGSIPRKELRRLAAAGTLCSLVGAAATHAQAGDAAPNYVPVVLLTGAAVAVLMAD